MKSVAVLFTIGACALIVQWPSKELTRPQVERIAEATQPTTSRAPASLSETQPSQRLILERQVLESPLSPRESQILGSPNANEWEHRLKIGLVGRLHSDRIVGGERLGGLYVVEMKREPRKAIDAIASLLGKLPAREFPIDRASLIDVAGDLPEFREEAKLLARQELQTSIAETKQMPSGPDVTQDDLDRALVSDDFDLLPMVAHSVLMRTTDSQDEALQLTIEALKAQRDPGIRETLANQFLAKFPEAKSDLYREISLAQIELPIEGEN